MGLEAHLPAPLLRMGPHGLLWWQWLALPLAAAVAITAGWLLGWITRRVLARLAARTATTWDDELLARLSGPLTLLWGVAVGSGLVAALELPTDAPNHLLRALAYLAFFWGGLRAVTVAFAVLGAHAWTRANPGLSGLLPLGRKIAKVALLGVGLVAILSELGFQVGSLLAGLGIGGLALALAAQKTVENLFGSVSIGVDQPFRVGDFVRIEDLLGNVESIGLRSTRIRTLDRTLVTIPNGKLADQRIETFAPRDRIRLLVTLGLDYATTAEQMRAVLAGIERALRAHPRIWPDGVSVRFVAFQDSALAVEVVAWFQTADFAEFTAIRQELFLSFLEIVERAGTSIAFPTRTVRLVAARPDPS
jgi:MscS family membrane protein